MKVLNCKRIAFSSLALLASAVLFSCKDGVSDTTADFAEAKKNISAPVSSNQYVVKGGSLSVKESTVQAKSRSNFNVTLKSYAKVDEDVAADAINFYSLEDNWVNPSYYPRRKAILPKVLLEKEETSEMTTDGLMIITTYYYQVDCISVIENQMALYADATKLIDTSGNPVLNYKKNEVAGEESDSWIYYIYVTKSTSLLRNKEKEIMYQAYGSWPSAPLPIVSASGRPTGKLRFTCAVPGKTNPYLGTVEDNKDWADTLNNCFLFQTMASDSSSWETLSGEDFSFVYHATADNSNPNATIAARTFTADTPSLPAGTQWRVLVKVDPSIKAPKWYETIYGHPAYVFKEAKAHVFTANDYWESQSYSGCSEFYQESPAYIVSPISASPSGALSFLPQNIPLHADSASTQDIFHAQNDLLFVTSRYADKGGYYSAFEWEVDPSVELASAEDFTVVTSDGILLPSTITFDGDSDAIIVTLNNQNYRTGGADIPVLYVGHGTKLKNNVEYPSQLEFGIYEVAWRPSHIRGGMQLYPDAVEEK